MTKHKHLTFSDRLDIESGLRNSKTFTLIASQIGKDPSTVSKEVPKHIQVKKSSVHSNKGNNCPKLCKPPYVCNGCPIKNRDCGFNKQFYNQLKLEWDKRASRKVS
ncbi:MULTISPECIES: helix-turn-helix domain-containing protein [unclassified Streptococcus]|uniref:helix-turn-helix domain-containing protein n=1 Tax=unclassified Streptococcus TaxID=2608887 RepID=UPI001072C334|nr:MULTISPECIES: helix-turn-helix domain-containing protein [unclassified Streptococcus]MBF0806324.1 helix-turn-helix domain-containing protein [Streptococcus sp. 19428wA2_WM07]TFU28048.1 helix-turn-helix domain-containing protein [Streptococcus sp. WM07]